MCSRVDDSFEKQFLPTKMLNSIAHHVGAVLQVLSHAKRYLTGRRRFVHIAAIR